KNRLGGISNKKDDFYLLFLSLDNRPNVHKLPEDLGVYLNIKGYCFFANTGTFNYESKSKERNYLLNPISQNGLKFIDNKEYVSDINIIKNNRELLQFEGYLSKINTRDSIYRTISITNNEINIKDEGNCNFTSQFILL